MSTMNKLWGNLVKKVKDEGFIQNKEESNTWYLDGEKAYTTFLIGETLRFEEGQSALLTTKQINIEKPIGEILWIMQDKTNSLEVLRNKYDIKFWDNWDKGDGTIGTAYGYIMQSEREVSLDKVDPTVISPVKKMEYMEAKQMGRKSIKLDQMDYLLNGLKTNPQSRRHKISLYDPKQVDGGTLPPCVWASMWYVAEGKLHLIVTPRSSDIALGLPFNTFQYQVLQHMVAQSVGLGVGTMTFMLGNPHIYDRHIPKCMELANMDYDGEPKIVLNPNVENFYDFKVNDVDVLYPIGVNPEKVSFDIAVHHDPLADK